MTRRVLVTGGAGYIGSVLTAHLLAEGYFVSVVDNLLFGANGLLPVCEHPRFTFCKTDIADKATVRELMQHCDVVVHLAALVGEPQCKKDETEAWRVNYESTRNLLVWANEMHVPHFIMASTCSNYGLALGDALTTEDSSLQPIGLYAQTKTRAETLDPGSCELAILRFATVYGISPRMRFDLLLNEFVRDALGGWLLVYDPGSWRPLVHVRDVVCFIERVIDTQATGTFNVGGHNRQKSELVETLKVLQPNLDVGFKDGSSDPRNYKVSFVKAESTGFRPEWTPEDGIKSLVVAIRSGFFTDLHSSAYRNA